MAKNISEKGRRKILTGNMWLVVFAITWPLFIYQFINSFYSLLDAIMLVNISTTSSSAGAILAQVKMLISSFGVGISGGGAILLARAYGAGGNEKARKFANVMFTWELIIIGLILVVFLPFAKQIMALCGCNSEIIAVSINYFRLQLVEQCIICVNNVFIASEKSKGNTKIIFFGNIMMMIIKLSLNALFVYGIKVTDMAYIELASIVSQLFMMAIGSFYLFRKSNVFQISYKYLSLKWEYSKPLLIMSLPLFLGKFVISIGKVAVNAICGTLLEGDTLLVGALGVSNNICGMITNPGNAFEDAESSIVSQNLGSRNMRRPLKAFLVSMAYMAIWAVLGFLITRVFFLDDIVGLFLTGEEASLTYIELIKGVFYYDCLTIPALAINAVVLGLLYGYGQTFLSTVNNVIRIVTRIGVLLIFKYSVHIETLADASKAAGLAMGISNIIIAISALVFLGIFFIKVKIKGYQGMHFSDPEPKMVEVDGVLMAESLIK